MFKGAALFLFLFTASVFAFPFPQRKVLRRLAPQLRDPIHGETNAQRLARGLPPLPPARRWNIEASPTETAKRAQGSDTYYWSGKIQINSTQGGKSLGYLEFINGWYSIGAEANGDTFSASFHKNGISQSVSFRSNSNGHPYLAGLVDPGVALGTGKGTYAFLGTSSVPTQANDTPQSDGVVSSSGKHFLTAFWQYDPTTSIITATGWADNNTSECLFFSIRGFIPLAAKGLFIHIAPRHSLGALPHRHANAINYEGRLVR
ncbi:uncharacterized protein EI90DRAFT_371568 [Cantharellus anzutake]|uniref:uncharacterized protein n=1 Tax=Cantharellus anzutake TaxID=1750568 RepID=UPI001907E83A|nr:uncharacterized protein EI90DRAFT_371568 [Cantharellus anzutake]KAF8334886.1 hypothetical protein EI90DRAFT_371568 [Cantharellus anzutake]